jgi:hypothetical protein
MSLKQHMKLLLSFEFSGVDARRALPKPARSGVGGRVGVEWEP